MSEQDRKSAEEEREAAERERERNEEMRQAAEGGAEQPDPGRVEAEEERMVAEQLVRNVAEEGRVEAEIGRVEAEEERASTRHTLLKAASILALPMAFIALVPSVIGFYKQDQRAAELASVVEGNKEAVLFICETTGILDSLVVSDAANIRTNLEDGLYARLVKQKILDPGAVELAQRVLAELEAAHELLVDPEPCVAVK